MTTAWFRRGDGAEFAVPEGSEAYQALVANGSRRIEGPGGAAEEAAPKAFDPQTDEDLAAGTKAEILAWAAGQGLEIALTKDDRKDDILAAVTAAIEAAKA